MKSPLLAFLVVVMYLQSTSGIVFAHYVDDLYGNPSVIVARRAISPKVIDGRDTPMTYSVTLPNGIRKIYNEWNDTDSTIFNGWAESGGTWVGKRSSLAVVKAAYDDGFLYFITYLFKATRLGRIGNDYYDGGAGVSIDVFHRAGDQRNPDDISVGASYQENFRLGNDTLGFSACGGKVANWTCTRDSLGLLKKQPLGTVANFSGLLASMGFGSSRYGLQHQIFEFAIPRSMLGNSSVLGFCFGAGFNADRERDYVGWQGWCNDPSKYIDLKLSKETSAPVPEFTNIMAVMIAAIISSIAVVRVRIRRGIR